MAKTELTMDLNLKAYPNELTPDVDNDYTVRVDTQTQPIGMDDLATLAAERIGCEPSLAQSILRVAMEEAARAVASGFCVSTPLCYVQPAASGVLMEEELSLPVDRNRIKVFGSFRQGPALVEAMSRARLKLFLQPATTGPYIAGMVSAMQTAGSKEVIPMRAGEMAVITGNKLKVVGDDPSVGIHLTSADNPETTFHITAAQIAPNMPKKLQFVLPAGITEGAWQLEVTTQYSGGSHVTKQPRTFTLQRPIYIGTPPTTGGGGDDGDDKGESPDPIV